MPGKTGQGRRYFPGYRHEKLVMTRLLGRSNGGVQISEWRCDCGSLVVMRTGNAATRNRSCGCDLVNRIKTPPERRIYAIWKRLRQRTKTHPSYLARGVGYDPRWESFALFFRDMGDTYVPGHHLHRIDSTQHYFAANCEWVSPRDHFERHNGKAVDKISDSS